MFVAKPLLDTLIYRTGSLIGAAYFTWAMNAGLTPKTRQCAPPPTAPTDHTVPRLGPRLGPAPIFATRAPPPLLITSPWWPCRRYMLLVVSIVWAANSFWLGVLAERHQREQEKKSEEMM